MPSFHGGWAVRGIKGTSHFTQGERPEVAQVWGWLGALGRLFSPSPFLGTIPRSVTPSTTVSSILRNPIYTVRSHRVGPCSSPPVPREIGPPVLHPRYVKSPCTSLQPSHPSLAVVRDASLPSWEGAGFSSSGTPGKVNFKGAFSVRQCGA